MKRDLQKVLIDSYPELYGNPGPRTPLAMFGFEVGDGWFKIIRDLSADLSPMVKALPPSEDADFGVFRVVQVKEKFGALRFYVDGGTVDIYERIGAAESSSSKTCERCGEPGITRGPGWLLTLCEQHQAERLSTIAGRGHHA